MNRALYPKGHPDQASIFNDLAHAYASEGNYDLAKTSFDESLKLCQASYPPAIYPKGHPELAKDLANMGALASARRELCRGVVTIESGFGDV